MSEQHVNEALKHKIINNKLWRERTAMPRKCNISTGIYCTPKITAVF